MVEGAILFYYLPADQICTVENRDASDQNGKGKGHTNPTSQGGSSDLTHFLHTRSLLFNFRRPNIRRCVAGKLSSLAGRCIWPYTTGMTKRTSSAAYLFRLEQSPLLAHTSTGEMRSIKASARSQSVKGGRLTITRRYIIDSKCFWHAIKKPRPRLDVVHASSTCASTQHSTTSRCNANSLSYFRSQGGTTRASHCALVGSSIIIAIGPFHSSAITNDYT